MRNWVESQERGRVCARDTESDKQCVCVCVSESERERARDIEQTKEDPCPLHAQVSPPPPSLLQVSSGALKHPQHLVESSRKRLRGEGVDSRCQKRDGEPTNKP